MKVEEALKKAANNFNNNREVIDKVTYFLINEIFDDFEKRTCENCKYYQKKGEVMNLRECNEGVSIYKSSGYSLVNDDFGCNKFEENQK